VKRGKELLQVRKRGETGRGGNDGIKKRSDKLKRKEHMLEGKRGRVRQRRGKPQGRGSY
jgi:hypothetical protein